MNKEYKESLEVIVILVGVAMVSLLFGALIGSSIAKNETVPEEFYQNEMTLKSYLAKKAGLIEQGGGTGHLYYSKDGEDYAIECKMWRTGKNSMQTCCKEGKIIWKQKQSDFIWINYIHNSCDLACKTEEDENE